MLKRPKKMIDRGQRCWYIIDKLTQKKGVEMAARGTANVAKYGGSVVIAVPPAILGGAAIAVGDRVAIWSPERGVMVCEKVIETGDAGTTRLKMADVYLGAQVMIDRVRREGLGALRMDDRECHLCGLKHGGVTFGALRMCLRCETMIAMSWEAQRIGLYGVKNAN